jgi:RHS repeat-associated protein
LGVLARSFVYDAENRQVSATINGTVSTFEYDGAGQRVSKTAGGIVTAYAYDAFGNLAAEYSQYGLPSPCGAQTCYVTADHLGSTRLLTDGSGSASTAVRFDYQPFGQEISSGTGPRTTSMGYLPAANGYMDWKFTGQPADAETGLNWFPARELSGAAGRFQSVDPGNAGAMPGDPQSWNGYAYVDNNPLSLTDPSGEGIFGWIGGIVGSFFGPWGSTIGYAAGSGIDAAIGGPNSDKGTFSWERGERDLRMRGMGRKLWIIRFVERGHGFRRCSRSQQVCLRCPQDIRSRLRLDCQR